MQNTPHTAGDRSRTHHPCSRVREAFPGRSRTCGTTPTRPRCSRELRAQVERAIAWGIDVTHLAPHLSAITLRPEFFDVYLELATDYRLPIRLPSTISAERAGFPFRTLAADEGVVVPDHFDHDWRAGSRARVIEAIATLQPGVTEIHIQPAIDTPELRAFAGAAADGWVADLELATSPELRDALDASGAVMIGYRELRNAMRSGSA